jgi:hypothetical protein
MFRYNRDEGGFQGWVERRLRWSRPTAYNLLNVHKRLGESVNQLDTLPRRVLYLLAGGRAEVGKSRHVPWFQGGTTHEAVCWRCPFAAFRQDSPALPLGLGAEPRRHESSPTGWGSFVASTTLCSACLAKKLLAGNWQLTCQKPRYLTPRPLRVPGEEAHPKKRPSDLAFSLLPKSRADCGTLFPRPAASK